MRACVVAIGDEVLSGQVVNTNSAFLASALTELGFSCDLHLCISDFDPQNHQRFLSLAEQFDVIVCSGGLGPTVDDLTRQLFAQLAGCDLIFDDCVYQELQKKFGDHIYHRLQAMIPSSAHLLDNPTGTAKGIVVKVKNCHVVALPGVPYEMKLMFSTQLSPYLQRHFSHLSVPYERILNFFDVVEVQIDPFIKALQKQYPQVAFGIYPSYGVVRVVCKSRHEEDIVACENFFLKNLASQVFSSRHEKIEATVYEYLKKHHLTLALAESVTGGEISSRLVALSGISKYFMGSLVCYSNEMKTDLLGVDQHVLKKYGAVSAEVCDLMLNGVFAKTHSDLAIAVTGIAGPEGGSSEKPVGLVFIGVAKRGEPARIHKCHFKGDRTIIIDKTATFAFGYMLQYLSQTR